MGCLFCGMVASNKIISTYVLLKLMVLLSSQNNLPLPLSLSHPQVEELPQPPQGGTGNRHLPLQLGMPHPRPHRYHIVSPLLVNY